MSEFKEKYKFNFEFIVDHSPGLPDGDPQGTWHITESDMRSGSEQSIVKSAIELQFNYGTEVKLYNENGTELSEEATHGTFVAYEHGIPQ